MNPADAKLLLINEICAYIEAGLSYSQAMACAMKDWNREHQITSELQADYAEGKETCGGPGC